MRLVIGTLIFATFAAGCGSMTPSGGREKDADPSSADESADAEVAADEPDRDEALLAELETEVVATCHAAGYLFERRKLGCSDEIRLSTSFDCNRAGIREAFAATGFQIDVVLDEALGKAGFPDDHGDGYSLDQCGETEDGRRFVHLVKRGEDGKIVVREIETHL